MCDGGRALAAAVALTVAMSACGAPVGVVRTDPRTVQRTLTRNILTAGKLSQPTTNVLYQRGLTGTYAKDPEAAMAQLHATAIKDNRRGDMFALAELSFAHADKTRKQSYYLASAVYAWAFLFPEGMRPPPSAYDARFRVACDLYNRGITEAFATKGGKRVDFQNGRYALPFGALDVQVYPEHFVWAGRQIVYFTGLADLQVVGLPTRFRWPGLGAPIAGRTGEAVIAGEGDDFVYDNAVVPMTAVLRLDGARRALAGGELAGWLEVYPASGPQTIMIEGREVPLESETTASLAYMLADAPVWKQEISRFLTSIGTKDVKTQLRAIQPYQRGRIPVVFVHGTASSSARWAEMLNELSNDPSLRDHFQFWFFTYDTGNPILYSAMLLREALTERVHALDPTDSDPAMQQMIVIGHSQGGLLTKCTVVDSGDAFWKGASDHPFDQVRMSDEARDLFRRAMFIQPLPFVHRVIFISTPQRGSYVAGSWLAHQAARLVTFPASMMKLTTDLLRPTKGGQVLKGTRLPTAVDNMTPGNRFIKALSQMPIAPGVHAYSIIAVKGPGDPHGQDDGVVEYDSASIEGVDSELIVRSYHSCQDNPHTIAEVRRILLLAVGEAPPVPTPQPVRVQPAATPEARTGS